MLGKAGYDSLQKAKLQLADDDIRGSIKTLLDVIKEMEEAEQSAENSDAPAPNELEHSLIIYSASLVRVEKSFKLGLVDYDKHSQERSKIINSILENIHGYAQGGMGMFADPQQEGLVYSVHIEDESLLSEQLKALAENLDQSK